MNTMKVNTISTDRQMNSTQRRAETTRKAERAQLDTATPTKERRDTRTRVTPTMSIRAGKGLKGTTVTSHIIPISKRRAAHLMDMNTASSLVEVENIVNRSPDHQNFEFESICSTILCN